MLSPSLSLHIVERPVSTIETNPRNARLHSERQIKQIANAIKHFGFVVPVLIDAMGQIVAGHGRLAAARRLGMTNVPTIELKHLSAAQAQAFALADNKLALNATWDDALLAEHFKELQSLNLDFELELTGFSTAEIDLFLATDSTSVDDEVPDVASGASITRIGDVWSLGKHRILCGNALDRDSCAQLMNRHRAAAVITDPPFNVPVQGHVSGLGAVQHREFAMASGEMNRAEFTAFLSRIFQHAASFSIDGSLHIIAMDWRHLSEMMTAGESAYTELVNVAVWDKGTGGMGSYLRSQHELFFIWKAGTAGFRNNVELGRHGRYRTNVWSYAGANSFAGRASEEGNLLAMHPTAKPVALIADAMLDCTRRGDIVLDPFLGSGTTLIAAERVGRIAYAIEIDPLYVDVAIRRWQKVTGDSAVRHDGVAFNDIEARRHD